MAHRRDDPPQPPCSTHRSPTRSAKWRPAIIDRLGVAAGETVRLSTRRGTIDVPVRAAGRIPEGVVFVPFCYTEAAANLLTNQALDPFGKIPELKYCAVKVEKAG